MLEALHHKTELPLGGAVAQMAALLTVLTHFNHCQAGGLIRNLCRNEIDGAANGIGAVAQGLWPFQYFYANHATAGGKIIGFGSGVGCWRNQYAVLHQRNT